MRKTTSSKHRDSFKLLFGDRDVLRKVAKIRNFLKIPEDMYSLESEKDKGALYEKWIADLVAIPDEKNFNSIKKVQNNLKEKKTSLKMANEQVGLLDKNHPINYLHNGIQEIISEYNLPKSYETNIYTYIMYGEMSWMTPQTFGVKIDLKKEGGVTLNIYHK